MLIKYTLEPVKFIFRQHSVSNRPEEYLLIAYHVQLILMKFSKAPFTYSLYNLHSFKCRQLFQLFLFNVLSKFIVVQNIIKQRHNHRFVIMFSVSTDSVDIRSIILASLQCQEYTLVTVEYSG